MTYQFKLQIPITRELKETLKQKAEEIGFSSVNEIVRLLITNFAKGKLNLSFVYKSKNISEEASEINLKNAIAEGLVEYKKNKTKNLDFSKSLHEQLIED